MGPGVSDPWPRGYQYARLSGRALHLGDVLDDARGVDGLVLEGLHDVQELVVDPRLRGERRLDVLQVRERILDFQWLGTHTVAESS